MQPLFLLHLSTALFSERQISIFEQTFDSIRDIFFFQNLFFYQIFLLWYPYDWPVYPYSVQL